MTKVLLLDSPSWRLFNPTLHTHLGILYLAGSLREAGHEVKVLDCHKVTSWDGQNLIIHEEMLEECDVLGLSATTANVNYGQQLAKAWTKAKVKVLGGTHVTHIFEGTHERFKNRKYFDGFDFLMWGECEEAFVKFCNQFPDVKSIHNFVPGLIWWDAFGLQIMPRPEEPDVTKLPGPAFDLWASGFAKGGLSNPNVKKDREFDANNLMSAALYTARGCPYGCTFCADARTKLREETFEQTETQVKQLKALGVQAVKIQDDTFTIKDLRARRISDILQEHGMYWRAATRVNLRDSSLFQYMSTHGCTELGFGIEHGSARMLKLMNKGTTPDANEKGIKLCQESGMIAKAFTMLGFPGETEESIDEMEEWILRVRPDAVTISIFQPFPGSHVWNFPEKYGVSIPDDAFSRMWQLGMDADPSALILDLPTISKERLFERKLNFVKMVESEIGHLDRTALHGNSGTFGPRVTDAGFTSEAC